MGSARRGPCVRGRFATPKNKTGAHDDTTNEPNSSVKKILNDGQSAKRGGLHIWKKGMRQCDDPIMHVKAEFGGWALNRVYQTK